jgi:hypothetical protein
MRTEMSDCSGCNHNGHRRRCGGQKRQHLPGLGLPVAGQVIVGSFGLIRQERPELRPSRSSNVYHLDLLYTCNSPSLAHSW